MIALGYAETTDMDLAGNTDRRRRAGPIEDMDGGIANGATDADRGIAAPDLIERRPDRGFGRTIEIPQLIDPIEDRIGKITRQRLAAAKRAEARLGAPARFHQQAPGRRRGLQRGRAAFIQEIGKGRTVGCRLARHQLDARAQSSGK